MPTGIRLLRTPHNDLLPPHEPDQAQNRARREAERHKVALFEALKDEQQMHAADIAARTGLFAALSTPRLMGIGHLPGKNAEATHLMNCCVAETWPRMSPSGMHIFSGMVVPPVRMGWYSDAFMHLGMSSQRYDDLLRSVSAAEHALFELNPDPIKALTSVMNQTYFNTSFNMTLAEMRTSMAHHINERLDALEIYLHLDYVHEDDRSQFVNLRFVMPECEEHKAIWRMAFWQQTLPQGFPVHPQCYDLLLPDPAAVSVAGAGATAAASGQAPETQAPSAHPHTTAPAPYFL